MSQYITNVQVGMVTLDHETFKPFFPVTLRFDMEQITDLMATQPEVTEKDYAEIGRQFCDGFTKSVRERMTGSQVV